MLDDTVEFGGFDRPRKLRVDINCISDYERLAGPGSSFMDALQTAGGRLTLGILRDTFWAMMKADDRRLTPERVGVMMQDYLTEGRGKLQDLADVMVEAVNKSGLMLALGGSSPNGNGAVTTTAPNSTSGSESEK